MANTLGSKLEGLVPTCCAMFPTCVFTSSNRPERFDIIDVYKRQEQKKAIRSGYDIDIIPSDLATYGRDAKALLKELQSQNERMFLVTFLVLNTGLSLIHI